MRQELRDADVLRRKEEGMEPATFNYEDPNPAMLENPLWLAIWHELKTWDISVPTEYNGYTGATGNHATAIYKAITFASPVHGAVSIER